MVEQASTTPPKYKQVPNKTMKAEWDILSTIWHTMDLFDESSRPRITWIKAHQDDKKPYEQLSLPAQLNVDADHLADQFIDDNMHANWSKVPRLPTCGAQLHLRTGTVTYSLKRELGFAVHAENMEEYLSAKNGWTPATFDSIDWEVHRLALNRHNSQRTVLIKYLHNILPVGKIVSRYDPKYPPGCTACDEPLETCPHVHQCPAQSRIEWRTKLKQTLCYKMEKLGTCPYLADLLVLGVHKGIHLHEPFNVPPTQAPLAVYNAQMKIGWDQL